MTHRIIYALILLLATGGPIFAAPDQIQTGNPPPARQAVMKGKLDGVNLAEGYIVANDIRFYIDISTRVYDRSGGLLAKQNLKIGQTLDMYFRIPTAPLPSGRQAILEKIVITHRSNEL